MNGENLRHVQAKDILFGNVRDINIFFSFLLYYKVSYSLSALYLVSNVFKVTFIGLLVFPVFYGLNARLNVFPII